MTVCVFDIFVYNRVDQFLLCKDSLWCLIMLQGQSYNDTNDSHEFVFDLGEFVGDLSVEEDSARYYSAVFFMITKMFQNF